MTKKTGLFSGFASWRRSLDEKARQITHRNAIALLRAQLILPMQTLLKIASVDCDIELKKMREPGFREAFENASRQHDELSKHLGHSDTKSPQTTIPGIDFKSLENDFRQDAGFAEMLVRARDEFSTELKMIRGKLQGTRMLHECFINAVRDHDDVGKIPVVLSSLKRLGELSKSSVPPSRELAHEIEEFTKLLGTEAKRNFG